MPFDYPAIALFDPVTKMLEEVARCSLWSIVVRSGRFNPILMSRDSVKTSIDFVASMVRCHWIVDAMLK